MTRVSLLRWHRSHPDSLLNAAALLAMLSTSVGGRDWQLPAGWSSLVVVLSWLPLTVRSSWPLPVFAGVLVVDTVHVAIAGHALVEADAATVEELVSPDCQIVGSKGYLISREQWIQVRRGGHGYEQLRVGRSRARLRARSRRGRQLLSMYKVPAAAAAAY
jgi:hypothetical protein